MEWKLQKNDRKNASNGSNDKSSKRKNRESKHSHKWTSETHHRITYPSAFFGKRMSNSVYSLSHFHPAVTLVGDRICGALHT